MKHAPYTTLIAVPDDLRGERVTLRPYQLDDTPALFASVEESRAQLRPWISWADSLLTLDESRAKMAQRMVHWLLREELFLGIWETATGRHLGECGLHHINWGVRRFAVGYWLRASAEGHGYMTEAVRLLVAMAFEALHANRVELICDARNVRSAAVAERVGFVREGCLRNNELASDGTLRDELIFSLVPADRA